MTDNEIMRALELFKSGKDENFAFVSGNALDLINRQKEEIERLQEKLSHSIGVDNTKEYGCFPFD